jgi:uncharacterized protein (TIGR04255 family)
LPNTATIQNPLTDPTPPEVPLPNAPLERVIAQVRFTKILKLGVEASLIPFQEIVGTEFPDFDREQIHQLTIGPEGVVPSQEPSVRWRFADATNDWTVSLAPDFVALETTRYSSREDFLARFRRILGAVESAFSPSLMTRVGVRYIDRIDAAALADIEQLVRPEVAGVLKLPFARDAAEHALSEHIFEVGEARILARWGILRAGSTVDPAVIKPRPDQSWLLDLDMFRASKRAFEPDALIAEARSFTERLYCFFRWSVTPAFLSRYGASL